MEDGGPRLLLVLFDPVGRMSMRPRSSNPRPAARKCSITGSRRKTGRPSLIPSPQQLGLDHDEIMFDGRMNSWTKQDRHTLVSGMICALALLAWVPCHHAASPSDGPAIYRILAEQGRLEDYFTEQIAEILDTLVQASRQWDDYGVNQPYRPDAVNVYLLDAGKLPEPSILAAYDIELDPVHLEGNAMADEATGILFVDTGFLKSLVTAALLFAETDLDTIAAVGTIRARGIQAFRDIWDPKRNPALLQAGYADQWVMLASGAAAFARPVSADPVGALPGTRSRCSWPCRSDSGRGLRGLLPGLGWIRPRRPGARARGDDRRCTVPG